MSPLPSDYYRVDLLIGALDLDLGELAELSLADSTKRSSGKMDQLEGELVTLTTLPRSKWQTLLNIEVIQVCRSISSISQN